MAAVGFDNFIRGLNYNLDPSVRRHLKNVYSCLAIECLAAAAGGYINITTGFLDGSILVPLLNLGLLITLMAIPDSGKNSTYRLGLLTAFSFCSGLGIGPLLSYAIRLNPTILPTALLGSGLIFVCFTLSTLYTTKRLWLYISGFISSGLSLVFVLGIASLFLKSALLFQVHMYLGLAVMCGFVIYDTQLIVEKRRRGDKDFIRHSLDLFIDLFSIFRYLLAILTQKENQERNNRRAR